MVIMALRHIVTGLMFPSSTPPHRWPSLHMALRDVHSLLCPSLSIVRPLEHRTTVPVYDLITIPTSPLTPCRKGLRLNNGVSFLFSYLILYHDLYQACVMIARLVSHTISSLFFNRHSRWYFFRLCAIFYHLPHGLRRIVKSVSVLFIVAYRMKVFADNTA
jgi:hypothetical protein